MLHLKNLAQIKHGSVDFGDFTLIVGPQASGKSIFLQMFKLLIDNNSITQALNTNGYNWGKKWENLFELYFGESMSGIWHDDTVVTLDAKNYTPNSFIPRQGKQDKTENVFYIPAQRVVTMAQGWPRNFGSFDIGDPYVLKSFSETIRVLMEKESGGLQIGKNNIFPQNGMLKQQFRELINKNIFHGATIELDNSSLKKRFLLNVANSRLPFMTWSAGQKEFMPLLLSFYHLMPSGKTSMKDEIKWVIIEEPEMGLHPNAIQSLMVIFLELIYRGYKVIIATHSLALLELAWAMNYIKQFKGKEKDLFALFSIDNTPSLKAIFKTAITEKSFKTYYFDRQLEGVHIRDISSLDAASEDAAVAEWGGISSFSSRAAEIIATLAANA